ncbi:MAG: polysaccharide biosynthesis/export family protein [Bacteroidales bacterium]|nr:polysaccharide biosynthesis/export family protein [Bacteroidales bacterium]
MASCNTAKKVIYMQDAPDGMTKETGAYAGIVVQPKDILSIVVSSRNPELAMGFNLPLQQYQAGSSEATFSYQQRLIGYQVDMEGNIDYPVFGKLKVAGLTREQLSSMLKQRFIQEGQILDAIVTTEFMNFKISVLGEVRNPGTFNIDDDRITLLEALGRAGDLTIYGRRDNVLVRRETGGHTAFHRVDLRTEALMTSPVYYLQQNDVVYVEPNETSSARSRINENRSVNVWISLTSVMISLASMIILLK